MLYEEFLVKFIIFDIIKLKIKSFKSFISEIFLLCYSYFLKLNHYFQFR